MRIRSWLTVLLFGLLAVSTSWAAPPHKALIVDGQNAHNWKETSPVLKVLLEDSGMFQVDVATSPAKGQDMTGFQPDFSKYALVVLNYQGDEWPADTKQAFVDYVKNGGGVLVYHFACAAFPKWPETTRSSAWAAGAAEMKRPARIFVCATASSCATRRPDAAAATDRCSRSS